VSATKRYLQGPSNCSKNFGRKALYAIVWGRNSTNSATARIKKRSREPAMIGLAPLARAPAFQAGTFGDR
jgi:hypothetical protein